MSLPLYIAEISSLTSQIKRILTIHTRPTGLMFTCETYKIAMYIFASLIFLELKTKKVHTKSHKRDHIYKLCLYTLEEHKCLILTS